MLSLAGIPPTAGFLLNIIFSLQPFKMDILVSYSLQFLVPDWCFLLLQDHNCTFQERIRRERNQSQHPFRVLLLVTSLAALALGIAPGMLLRASFKPDSDCIKFVWEKLFWPDNTFAALFIDSDLSFMDTKQVERLFHLKWTEKLGPRVFCHGSVKSYLNHSLAILELTGISYCCRPKN